MVASAIDAYRRQIEKELQAGKAAAGGADIGFHAIDPGDPHTPGVCRLVRLGAYVQHNLRATRAQEMARRVATVLLLEPALGSNCRNAKGHSLPRKA
jgi:hypothetical protein